MFFSKAPLYSVPFWERFIAWYEQTTLHELLAYLWDKYFTIHFHVYEFVPFGPADGESARLLIFGIAIGLVIASFMIAHTRTKLGGFLRKMIKSDCLSPENAKTLQELGEFRNASVRRELRRGVTLRKFVRCVEEEQFRAANAEKEEGSDTVKECDDAVNKPRAEQGEVQEPKKRGLAGFKFTPRKKQDEASYVIDFSTAHFYIPEDLKYRVEVRFERKGSGRLLVVFTIIGSILFTALTCRFLPDIFQLMDNIIGHMAPR
ncbi:MAG: hypothetical protein IJW30_06155 [Clostridia bacterium]|nr:hypothetical protein [Clostridia bacterium]